MASSATAQTSAKDSLSRVLLPELPYGSASMFSPLSVFLNKGFDQFQAKNSSSEVWEFPYGSSYRHGVGDALLHPAATIEKSPGWTGWLRREVLPVTYSMGASSWAANYTEHMIAGGLTYRRLDEWYRRHGAPYPRVLAGLTTFGAATMNEAVEHPLASEPASSSVADLYLFDLGGILLFNWDPVVRAFAGTLQMADWSTQPSFTSPDGGLRNVGQYSIAKIPLPATRARLFVRFGMGIQGGLSLPVNEEHAFTFAWGADTEVRNVDPVTRAETIMLRSSAGVFFDRNNSLLASLTAGPAATHVALNVYPGVLPGPARDLGLWAGYTADRKVILGLASRQLGGIGVGYGR